MAIINLRVRRGPFSGRAEDGARLNIVAGVYQADHDGDSLVFAGADKRTGGTITVNLRDYPDIGSFPDSIEPNSQIELA
ncbi:hypothetical protein AWB82_04208 [Caballeronia glebae]|uniref:Uncharacterized protein n=1 Tax=Caballeronia glebae TaxID=1777143 RepID=A0A158BJQ2_9BURK|nr:hypothetical protein [Caballeronia glebae]SAK70298.1 hypothetical protein AWB82_04208 [Caballeronia glebae]